MNDASKSILKDTFEECGLQRSESRKNVEFSLKQLEGVYVSIREGNYQIIHDKLFDVFAKFFGKQMTSLFIKYASSEFIRERFVCAFNEEKDESSTFCVTLEENNLQEYFVRLVKDWRKMYLRDVFGNRILKSKLFRRKF